MLKNVIFVLLFLVSCNGDIFKNAQKECVEKKISGDAAFSIALNDKGMHEASLNISIICKNLTQKDAEKIKIALDENLNQILKSLKNPPSNSLTMKKLPSSGYEFQLEITHPDVFGLLNQIK